MITSPAEFRPPHLLLHLAAFVACMAGSVHAPFETAAADDNREPMEKVKLDDSGKDFVLEHSGERFLPWGFNYVGDFGRIVEEYWEDDWARVEKDFREMRPSEPTWSACTCKSERT